MSPSPVPVSRPPNIIFVLTDQQRGDCLSALGHPVLETPNLDMLAARGTIFTASYSSCPSCIGARASLFTGLSPSTHGRLGYRDRVPWRYADTLPELLRRAGYQTHVVGKTHFYPQRAHLGFESMDSYEGAQNFTGRYVNDYHEWLNQMTAGRLIMEQHHLVPEPTWWVFTSDHGEMLGDHCLFRKTFAYEGSARTPLIVTPPRQKGGRTCRAPVLQEDLMPTMLDIAGAPIPSAVEGRSLLPLIADAPGPVAWREFAHGEHSACYAPDHGMQYLTDGLEKYVWYTQTGQEQLFDLADDPQESHDLAAVSGAHSRLERWRGRMVEELAPRSEDGLSDGRRLISGRSLPAVRPALLQ